MCFERIFKGIYFSQFSHTYWWRIPAKQISMKLHHWCINTMKIAVTLAKSEKQSCPRCHGPVLAILFHSSKQTFKREKADLFQGLVSCALGSAPWTWTLLFVPVLVGEGCSCVLSVQCHITCLPGFSWGNLHFPEPSSLCDTAHLPGLLQLWARSLPVFYEDVLSAPLVSAEVSWALCLLGSSLW